MLRRVGDLPHVRKLLFVFVLLGTDKLTHQKVRPKNVSIEGDFWFLTDSADTLFAKRFKIGFDYEIGDDKSAPCAVIEEGNREHLDRLISWARKNSKKMWWNR